MKSMNTIKEKCSLCKGVGWVKRRGLPENCPSCNGMGVVVSPENYYAKNLGERLIDMAESYASAVYKRDTSDWRCLRGQFLEKMLSEAFMAGQERQIWIAFGEDENNPAKYAPGLDEWLKTVRLKRNPLP